MFESISLVFRWCCRRNKLSRTDTFKQADKSHPSYCMEEGSDKGRGKRKKDRVKRKEGRKEGRKKGGKDVSEVKQK